MSAIALTQPELERVEDQGSRARQRLSWMTVALIGVVIAYVDGFWVTSLQGTVGAIERNQPPFTRWLHDSTLMLPLFVLAVSAALVLTRRWFGGGRREFVTLAAAAVLVVMITSAVSIAEVTASSAYDYHLEARDLALSHVGHVHPVSGAAGGCTGLCAARHSTLMLHVRAVSTASLVFLITNMVLVVWALTLRGGQLWKRVARSEMPAVS
jgi:hypothetical protein